MDKQRWEKQLSFIIEIDKLKSVFRQTLIMDSSRRENDTEHSWHLAVMAMLLGEYVDAENADINHAIKMALVHDIIEVYAGDTFAYDSAAIADKEQREQEAADKVFGLLPDDQRDEFRALWDEFEAMQTAESMYAAALDRLQPLIHNYMTNGHTWKLGKVTPAMVYKRMQPIKQAMPGLWGFVEFVINDAIEKGYIEGEKIL